MLTLLIQIDRVVVSLAVISWYVTLNEIPKISLALWQVICSSMEEQHTAKSEDQWLNPHGVLDHFLRLTLMCHKSYTSDELYSFCCERRNGILQSDTLPPNRTELVDKLRLTPNSCHPNISIHLLYTDLWTFPKVPTKRICLTIESFFSW